MSDSEELPSVLLVTDSSFTHKSFNRLIGGHYTILHAESSERAWELLQQEASLVLVVCELAKAVNETALLERMRHAEGSLSVLPMLLLVGQQDDDEFRDSALALGASDFIHMPFSSNELIARVNLHAGKFGRKQQGMAFELASQGSSVDLLNTQTQEKYFFNRLRKELSFSSRHKSYLSICLVKIDDALSIEEYHGKGILRAILRATAKMIEQKIRREDVFAYLGDEIFAIFYPLTNGLGAHTAIKRLMEKIQSTQLKHGEANLSISLSVGLYSTIPSENQDIEQLMSVIEQRLEKAESLGGGQIVSSKTEQEKNNPSIDQAINMIAFNRSDELIRQIPYLVDSLLPLLEFMQKNNSLEFNRILDAIDDDDS